MVALIWGLAGKPLTVTVKIPRPRPGDFIFRLAPKSPQGPTLPIMEMREKFLARVLNAPADFGFTEIKFIHSPQIFVNTWVRLRCQYQCPAAHASGLTPPRTLTADDTTRLLDEYRFGIMARREVPVPFPRPCGELWREFQDDLLRAEHECFVRGYGKAFALAAGNCLFGHHDDTMRPCTFPGKNRPTLESIGINLHETLAVLAWEHLVVRDPEDPLPFFGLLLLE